MKLLHHVQDTIHGFRHRIVIQAANDEPITAGPWVSYKGVASLEFNGARYGVATEYFEGDLPVNEIFQVVVIKDGLV